jgi:hypothetical protein
MLTRERSTIAASAAGGAVTKGRRIAVVALDAPIRPIHSGVLTRRRETLTRSAARLLEFTKARFAS